MALLKAIKPKAQEAELPERRVTRLRTFRACSLKRRTQSVQSVAKRNFERTLVQPKAIVTD